MRAPDQVDKQHPETDLMTQAIIRGAEGYRVAVPLMEAWDNLPRSVQVAICMEFADLRTPDVQPAPVDRKTLVEVIEQGFQDARHMEEPRPHEAIADARRARGLRLPHVSETPECEHDSMDVLTPAARDVLAERQRQMNAEGWTPEHDDTHDHGEMARAAACYAWVASLSDTGREYHAVPDQWPSDLGAGLWPAAWKRRWWKPTDRRRDLVKAGALILAEIERLDRAAPRVVEGGDDAA